MCGVGFDFQSQLKEHMHISHKTELKVMANCQLCLAGFDSKEVYLTHVTENPENVRYVWNVHVNFLLVFMMYFSIGEKAISQRNASIVKN